MMERTSLRQTLTGYFVVYLVLESTGRALDGWGFAAGKSAGAIIGLAAAFLVQAFLLRERNPKRVLLSLGFGRPDMRVLCISGFVSIALLATMPFLVAATGGTFDLPDNWQLLALSILLLNGIAEETVYRGYLFHRLRKMYTIPKAVVLGTLLAGAAHVPIVATAGVVVGGLAILVAVLIFLPFATLFERGGNTLWAPATIHFAADCIIPLGALGLVTPMAIGYWMVAQVLACYVAALAVSQSPRVPCGTRGPSPSPSAIHESRCQTP